jgi:hypothetical protein
MDAHPPAQRVDPAAAAALNAILDATTLTTSCSIAVRSVPPFTSSK